MKNILRYSPIIYKKLTLSTGILAQVFHNLPHVDSGFFRYLTNKNYRFFFYILYIQLIFNYLYYNKIKISKNVLTFSISFRR